MPDEYLTAARDDGKSRGVDDADSSLQSSDDIDRTHSWRTFLLEKFHWMTDYCSVRKVSLIYLYLIKFRLHHLHAYAYHTVCRYISSPIYFYLLLSDEKLTS